MTESKRPIQALGEIALRVRDLPRMRAFYEDCVGLEFMQAFPHAVFFKIAEGHGGHTQVLALFDRSGDPNYQAPAAEGTSVDHIAFTIGLEDYESEKARLEAAGLRVETAEHAWVQWRSLYVTDPEGNFVEWVCFDARINPG